MRSLALITGAADRIGRGIAKHIASKGIDIIIHYNTSESKASKLKEEILNMGVNCETIGCDFSKQENLNGFIEKVGKKFNIKYLINNASIFYPSSIYDSGFETLDAMMNINFKAPYIFTKEFSKTKNGRCIINILDTNVGKNKTNYFDYLLSKKLLMSFTKMSAVELAPQIRVNAISPGLILPPSDKSYEYLERLSDNIPLKRIGSVKKITNAVDFILENDFITGEIINIDGGEHLT